MRRLPTAAWLVMLVSMLAWSGPPAPAGARQEPRSETEIRGAVVRIAQVVEVLNEDGTRHQPTLLPNGAVVSVDNITLIPSGFDAQLSPLGLVLLPTGSGTIVSHDGLILTNAHVVRPGLVRSRVAAWQRNVADQGGRYQLRVREGQFGILRLNDPQSSAPPSLAYFAGWASDDTGAPIIGAGNRDLAVLKIAVDLFEQPFTTAAFQAPFVVEPGYTTRVTFDTAIRIFGYPHGVNALIGTPGSVTGFEQDADLRWIVTDADVSPGNSGGAAVNEAGQLIGVPTEVNCVVTDTEADCPVTENAAVKILPITAAEPLLARAGLEQTPPLETSTPTETTVPPMATTEPESSATPSPTMPVPTTTPILTDTPIPTQIPAPTPTPTREPTATAAPEPLADDGPILLREDFSDPARGVLRPDSWANDEGVPFSTAYEDGEGVMEAGDAIWSGRELRWPVPGGPHSHAAIAVDARLVDGENVYIGVACRYNPDNDEGYELHLDTDFGSYRIVRVDKGEMIELLTWDRDDAVRLGEEWNRIELNCTGAAIGATINGVQLATVVDHRYTDGEMAILTGHYAVIGRTSRVETRFDDLVIRETQGG